MTLPMLVLNRIVIVVGYKGKELIDYVGKEYMGLKIEYIKNPIYDRTNNSYSLALAKQHLQEDDSLLIESDLIYDDGIFYEREIYINSSARWYIFMRHMPGDRGRSDE